MSLDITHINTLSTVFLSAAVECLEPVCHFMVTNFPTIAVPESAFGFFSLFWALSHKP